MTLRVCAVTGARADFGLLRPVLRALRDDGRFELQLVATGAHLSHEFGFTITNVEDEGFAVDERVEMLLSSDTPVGITKSLGLATIGFADSLARLQPDLMVLLGDRYEILAAAQAALVARIPVAHLSGGDVTEGAIDDAMRHAITKLSHLHFVTNPDAGRRVRQMGEDPERVILAGNPALDDLVNFDPLPTSVLERELGLELRARNLLVTYHPVTLADEPPEETFRDLLAALDDLGSEIGIVLTLPNADTWGRVLLDMTREFAAERANAVAHESLGQVRYWSCLKTFDAIVGNSSSALLEAPAVATPAVNVGVRQRGRLQAASTINCAAERHAIRVAIEQALAWEKVPEDSPYGDGHATARIIEVLASLEDPRRLVSKRFHPT